MDVLSDDLLIEALMHAKKLQLDTDFISIIEDEIKRRGLNLLHNKKPPHQ